MDSWEKLLLVEERSGDIDMKQDKGPETREKLRRERHEREAGGRIGNWQTPISEKYGKNFDEIFKPRTAGSE